MFIAKEIERISGITRILILKEALESGVLFLKETERMSVSMGVLISKEFERISRYSGCFNLRKLKESLRSQRF